MLQKIVFLGNHTDWWEYSLADLYKIEYVKCFNSPFFITNKRLANFLFKVYNSKRLEKIVFLFNFLLVIFFPYFCRSISSNHKKPIIVIIYDRNILANNIYFLKYLRKHYKHIKLVYMFTNIVKFTGAQQNNFVEKLKKYYDLIYAFDPSDAEKYSFKYNPLIYSKNTITDNASKQSIFYVGKSKDRYDTLIKVYERLNKLNISNKFYIFGVEKSLQKYNNKIIYNKLIPYKEALRNIQESDCLLDIIQSESEGLTIKVCEAIFYNKLLITTNLKIKNYPFYDERYIKIIKDADEITKDFFENKRSISYDKSGIEYFSTFTFLNKLNKDLDNI